MAVDPSWIAALTGAAVVGAGAARTIYRFNTRRIAQSRRERLTYEKVWGTPELRDDSGVVYQQAEPGLDERTTALEDAHATHRNHPPGRTRLAK
jgi:hypothetical protein